ncbi:MAG: hypothetical protein J6N52_02185 [Clostridia bacterium]|nr:hypothetical protein [Clostridia bacterium]
MEIKITYPHIERRGLKRRQFLGAIEWLILFAAFVCPIINIAVGGKAWSIIVLMSLYMIHTLILSPDLVEYNRISQFIKFIICLCILLVLIDVFLHPGWVAFATSVICCCGLIVSGTLFFTDFRRQKKNMFPMLLFVAFSIIRAIVGICLFAGEVRASFILMEVLSLILLLMFAVTLGNDFIRELHCRFHIR